MDWRPEFETAAREALSALRSAFAGVPAPEPTRWVAARQRPNDDAAARKIAAVFAAKPRSELDEEFWSEQWSGLCYATAESYRYLLPSLLEGALNSALRAARERAESKLWGSAVYALSPSAWRLYWEGGDAAFVEQARLLTEEQRRAVAAFLGAAMSSSSHYYEHSAAHALAWGWNAVDTSALSRAREFYRRMTTHAWPEPEGARERELAAAVRRAFEATPRPADDDMVGSMQGDEPAEYGLEFRGVDWRALHPEFISFNSAALSFFTPEAFRYFIPAFVIADIHGESGNANPLFHLTNALADEADELHGHSVAKLSRLVADEREALRAYLEWRADEDEYGRREIRRALRAYWKRQA